MKLKTAFLFFIVFLWVFTGSVSAAQQLNLTLPPVIQVIFPNGLRLLVVKREHTHNVALTLMIGAGQITESEKDTGITDFMQHYLMAVPVSHYHDAVSAIERKGGLAGAESGPDNSSLNMLVSPKVFPFAVKILSSLFQGGKINIKRFNQIKKEMLGSIKSSRDNAFQALYGIFLRQFYAFHPYREPVSGTTLAVKNITPQELEKYFEAYYVPNNMVLAVVGNVSADRVIQDVSQGFSKLKSKPLPPQNIYYQPVLSYGKQIHLQAPGNISWIFAGFSAPRLSSRNYATMQVINAVLGSSIGSRLWNAIREKRGLAYELSSQYSAREGPSHFIAYVITRPTELNKSRFHFLKQISLLEQKQLTEKRLDEGKREVIGHFILKLETNSAQAKYLAWSDLMGKGIDFYKKYISEIRKVTPQMLRKVSRKYLQNYILISVQ
ncbi:MAG: insulinase family protein [Candidatus Eremiobacteraeota bacterium]|nr:insulinase family protein [Candidatus Eremiobacteraeota bacterium]